MGGGVRVMRIQEDNKVVALARAPKEVDSAEEAEPQEAEGNPPLPKNLLQRNNQSKTAPSKRMAAVFDSCICENCGVGGSSPLLFLYSMRREDLQTVIAYSFKKMYNNSHKGGRI